MMMLGRSNTCEAAAVFVGAAKAGVITVPFRSHNAAEIESAIKTVNPKGMVFSPNQLVGDAKFIDVL
jgi:acyl-coenzyme A synthetase/AMP-(fatty) acid ligase